MHLQSELKKVMQMYIELANVPTADQGTQYEEDDEIDFGEETFSTGSRCDVECSIMLRNVSCFTIASNVASARECYAV